MRLIAIACVVVASTASADVPMPIFPPPGASPGPPAPAPTPTPPPPPPAPPIAHAPDPKAAAAASAAEARISAERACESHDPSCNWLATLGGLERQSMARAIAARGYTPDPAPWGKTVGKIRVYNEDVFAEKNWLRFFNHFHVTSKEFVVRDEVILRPGEVWNQDKIEETARRLRDPIFTSVIAVIPVTSSEPGKVDILVVTRDLWSLRLNTAYTFQSGKLTYLATSLSENNFLGRRKLVAVGLVMDQGAIAVGPQYIDKNFLRQHLDFRASVNTIVNRDALFGDLPHAAGTVPLALQDQTGRLQTEGSSSSVTLSKPLWNLGEKWGWSTSFSHRFGINRTYFGTAIRPVWCPAGSECIKSGFVPSQIPADELMPWAYDMRSWSAGASVVRSWGTRFKQAVTLGYGVASTRPHVFDSFPGTVDQREAFARAVLPRSEFSSVPSISYAMYTPRYKIRRNVGTYDLAEDYRLGPSFDASFGVGLKALGGDYNFWRASASAAYTFPWCRDGSVTLSTAIATRFQHDQYPTSPWIDNAASGTIALVSPTYRHVRLAMDGSMGTRWNDTTNAFLSIGSDTGLRGFDINQFSGQRLAGVQTELRSEPIAVWVFRAGGVLFYDVGGAANSFSQLDVHNDVGIGLRALVPQTSRQLFRFDLAFPLDGGNAGHPRFIAGFRSEF